MSSEPVSDERLADIAEIISLIVKQGDCRIYDAESKVPLPFKFDTLLRAITELQTLRSKPVASGAVKPLEWKGPDENTAYGEQGGFVYTVMSPNRTPGWRVWVHLKPSDGSASIGGGIITVRAETREAAIAAAEADYRSRILSALLPKATAPVVSESEEQDGRVEIIEQCDTMDGGTALTLRQYDQEAVAIVHFSPSQPQPKAVTEEMVERAMASIEGEPDLFITKGALRWALEAAMKEA